MSRYWACSKPVSNYGDGDLRATTMRDDVRPPEYKLILSVLYQAIIDYYGLVSTVTRAETREARAWINNEQASESWSCRWICDHLGLDHPSLKKALKKAIAPHPQIPHNL